MEFFIDIKVELAERGVHDGDACDLFEVFKHIHGLEETTQERFWRRLAGIVVKLDELINNENPAKQQHQGYGLRIKTRLVKTRVGLPLS